MTQGLTILYGKGGSMTPIIAVLQFHPSLSCETKNGLGAPHFGKVMQMFGLGALANQVRPNNGRARKKLEFEPCMESELYMMNYNLLVIY